jgi:hypothetical protein
VPELKTTMALVKDEEDHRFAQFLKDVDSMKMLIKVRGEWHAQFQNAIDSVIKMEKKKNAILNSGMRWIQ